MQLLSFIFFKLLGPRKKRIETLKVNPSVFIASTQGRCCRLEKLAIAAMRWQVLEIHRRRDDKMLLSKSRRNKKRSWVLQMSVVQSGVSGQQQVAAQADAKRIQEVFDSEHTRSFCYAFLIAML